MKATTKTVQVPTGRITRATFKKFVKSAHEAGLLRVKHKTSFDGMYDCVMPVDSNWVTPTGTYDSKKMHTLGFDNMAIYTVGNSRDSYRPYKDDSYAGIHVYNCCGSFIVAVPRYEAVKFLLAS